MIKHLYSKEFEILSFILSEMNTIRPLDDKQKIAIPYMAKLFLSNFQGCLLASEMGAGKTVQATK